ncbi:hypothetical protein [Fundidesulfovibrio putealis]|uniref:hypothetical protein n=1 Tax=Fundidesulfovibrio putealis TaxID=270496 RepID=UPI000424D974|nr:hypothetical protein [Fundidesulfovibrio putealis]
MQSELTYLFTVVMPLLFVTTGIYVCFSIAACAASSCSERIDRFFAPKLVKSVPFVLIALLVDFFR